VDEGDGTSEGDELPHAEPIALVEPTADALALPAPVADADCDWLCVEHCEDVGESVALAVPECEEDVEPEREPLAESDAAEGDAPTVTTVGVGAGDAEPELQKELLVVGESDELAEPHCEGEAVGELEYVADCVAESVGESEPDAVAETDSEGLAEAHCDEVGVGEEDPDVEREGLAVAH